MVVEVHCIPAIDIKWDYALPWITSPPNVVFVQPHGFLEESYMPLAVEDIDWVEVNYGDGDNYEGNIASVYLGNHDYEETKASYIAKVGKTSCSLPMFLESPPYVIVPHHGSLFPVASIFSLPCLWIPRAGCISIKS